MNNGWHVNSRTAAWREAFSKAMLADAMSAARGRQMETRALARKKIAEYYRRKSWREAMLKAAAVIAAIAVVALAMLLKALVTGAR